MIAIRTSADKTEPTLIGLEVTLQTAEAIYELASTDAPIAAVCSIPGNFFGRIAWPTCRFRISTELAVEQQMFIADHATDVAASWTLHGRTTGPVALTVRPLFVGCPSRQYRDAGFRSEADEVGGRLTWLPNVTGPKVIADTNGRYVDEPARTGSLIGKDDPCTAPGRFEFQLSAHPSVLILSSDEAKSANQQFVGSFLASLLRPEIGHTNHRVPEHLLAA